MARVDKDRRYYMAIVKSDQGIALAYAPNDEIINCGDLLELENGFRGTCIMSDNYADGGEVLAHEAISGLELMRVVRRYRKVDIKWEEEDHERV